MESEFKAETISKTFRIDESLLEQLQQQARDRRVSINTLMNQVLRQFMEFYAHADKAGYISVPKGLVIRLMDARSEEEMTEMGKQIARDSMKDAMMMLGYDQGPVSFLAGLETWMRVSGIPYVRKVNGNIHSYFVHHNMGRKWSVWFASLLQVMCWEIIKKSVELETTDRCIVFKMDVSNSP